MLKMEQPSGIVIKARDEVTVLLSVKPWQLCLIALGFTADIR